MEGLEKMITKTTGSTRRLRKYFVENCEEQGKGMKKENLKK